MTLEEAVNSLLMSSPKVTTLLGEAIYCELSPQDEEFPRLVFCCITEESIRTQAGCSGLVKGQLVIELYSTSSSERREMTLAVQDALNGLKWRELVDFSCRLISLGKSDNSTETFQTDSGSDQYVYLAALTFDIWYTETIPATA